MKNVLSILLGIALKLWIALGSMDFLILILPIQEHKLYLSSFFSNITIVLFFNFSFKTLLDLQNFC